MGPSTAWTQQWTMLREKGHRLPDPIKSFYDDLQSFINMMITSGHEVILMMDANENIGDKPTQMTQLLRANGLTDIMTYRHGTENIPSTYARGSKCIDYIFGTDNVCKHTTASGILPLGFGYPSDHRAIFIRINLSKFFASSVQALEHPSTRLLRNASPIERQQFIEHLETHYTSHNLSERLEKLYNLQPDQWTPHHQQEYERCDDQHIKGMLAAERKVAKIKRFDWSPKFQTAASNHAFWKVCLSLRLTQKKPNSKFIIWASAMGIEEVETFPIQIMKQKLRNAQKTLREVKKNATNLREEHLKSLIENADDLDDKKKERQLKIILRAHKRKDQYTKLQKILKPIRTGGINRIIVPKNFNINEYPYEPEVIQQWESIHDPVTIQEYIQKRNMTHFGQAHGTPFTIAPLNKLDWAASSSEAEEILNGSIPEVFDNQNEFVQQILEHLASLKPLPEIDTYIEAEHISRGFKRWRETTTTSPSGAHLGLRRIPAYPCQHTEIEKYRKSIQNIQAWIINIPLRNGFSPRRWQTVINAMLEKIPGKPFLHKLRVIHILEADYNLVLKEIFGRRLTSHCEIHNRLGDFQDGFRKGRSTIKTLLRNEMIQDYNSRMKTNNFTGLTDIAACFDRIIPSLVALSNRQHGCPKKAVKLHAETLQLARYHLRTSRGISESAYNHSNETPIYGNGQGAGDSPSQWNLESVMLFDIYKQNNKGATLLSPDKSITVNVPLAAFADDTNLFGNDAHHRLTVTELADDAKQAFHTWNNLLYAAGHSLELTKCGCYFNIWEFDDDGQAYIIPPDKHRQKIEVQDVHGNPKNVPQLDVTKSQKILGAMKNPLGLQQDEIARLKAKSNEFATKINLQFLTREEANIAYRMFYVPAMRYSLAITAINQMDLETIQTRATTAFLCAAGYPRTMPREVVFASKSSQGLGFHHLYDLQGSDGLKLLLQELNNTESTTQKMIQIAIEVLQLESGLSTPIMENTEHLDYINWGWLLHIRDFLQHINGKIHGASKPPVQHRQNDTFIMESPTIRALSSKDRQIIQRCHLYLQVQTISDMATSDGKSIDPAWFDAHADKPSKSLLKWPRQGNPGKRSWTLWNKMLKRAFLNKHGKLLTPLGNWTTSNNHRVWQTYATINPVQLLCRQDGKWSVHKLTSKNRRNSIFMTTHERYYQELPVEATPITIIKRDKNQIHTLPIETVAQLDNNIPPSQNEKPLANLLRQSTHLYLIRHVMTLLDLNDIKELPHQRHHFQIASDGSHTPHSRISTYGWTISIDRQLLAKGRGPAPANPNLASPFRAEAYGMASVLAFIRIIIEYTGIQPENHRWTMYVDNAVLIKRLMRQDSLPPSKNILLPDADITITIQDLLKKFPIRIEHIESKKSNNNGTQELPWPSRLHDMADALATQQRTLMKEPETLVVNHRVCLLSIQNEFITRDVQKWILYHAGKIPIQQYYKDKFGWNESTFNSITWHVQNQALQTFGNNDQTRILKFVHDWLPTGKRLHREKQLRYPRCQMCPHLLETNMHLFCCKHIDMKNIVDTEMAEMKTKDFMSHGHRALLDIMWTAFKESAENPSWAPDPTTYNNDILTAIQDQTKIGWQQLYYGRVASSIIDTMENSFRRQKLPVAQYTGKRWCKRLIKHVWQTMLQLWNTRNSILHNKNIQDLDTLQRQYLTNRVEKCYDTSKDIPISDKDILFPDTKETMLRNDTRTIKTWLTTVERALKAFKRKHKLSPNNDSRTLMETYLQWKPTIRKWKGKRKKDDLHPP